MNPSAKNEKLFPFFALTGCVTGETFCVFVVLGTELLGKTFVVLFTLPEMLACSLFGVGIGCNNFVFGNIAFIIFCGVKLVVCVALSS